jgi:hypothetical protein
MKNDPETREWWLTAGLGENRTGPYTEAEAKQIWKDRRPTCPLQGVLRGPDAGHLSPAHPSWCAGAPPSDAPASEWAAALSADELADAIDRHNSGAYTRPDYRKAMLAEAAARLRREMYCLCCAENDCGCEGTQLATEGAGPVVAWGDPA